MCVGLPYIALATTTPLLSRWLAHIAPDLNPVRFFAASNIGSFLGLLSYPFFFERLLPSLEQTRWWSWAYVLYAALFAACGALTISRAPNSKVADASALANGWRRSSADVGALFGARFGPADRNHQCHHAMVGGRAVPVGGPAQRVPPHLRDRLRLSAGLPPRAVWRRIPAAGGNEPRPARAGILSLPVHRRWCCRRRRCSQAA